MYSEKIADVKKLVTSYNLTADKLIDFDEFLGNLQREGGTTEAALALSTWADLEDYGLPVEIAKAAEEIFGRKETWEGYAGYDY